jgi:predicted PurR-regulated permease PerM
VSPQAPVIARTLPILIGLALVLGFLYWARVVLIPVALAILMTFLLTPAVSWLQRRHLARAPAVILVTLLALGAAGMVGWAVTRQITDLIDTYPRYEQNINAKIASFRARGREGLVDKAQAVAQRIASELEEGEPAPTPSTEGAVEPQTVRIVEEEGPFGLSNIWSVAGPMLEPIANAGLVLVLMIFMLINREDLRDRVIALVGQVQLAETTRAFDDAGERISRYLLMQLIVNVGFGIAVMLGLMIIGVPYAPLWGFFAAVFRYIPYLGPWLAALLPIALSLLISRDWSTALMVVGLFAVLELVTNMAVEPLMYGRGIGVSQAALLVSVAFWTWFWGPVGLILASPLTVCLVVLGKHVPFLRFFETLLGDRPALDPPIRYYQRLLARDQDEAAELAEEQAGTGSFEQVYDQLLMPALSMARGDLRAGKLDEDGQKYIVQATRQIAEELARRARIASARQLVADDKAEAKEARAEAKAEAKEAKAEALAEAREAKAEGRAAEVRTEPAPVAPSVVATPLPARIKLLVSPARDATDETALAMLLELIDPLRYELTIASASHLASDVVALLEREAPAILCIGSVPPGGLAQSKYICLRARARFAEMKIVIGRWGLLGDELEKNRSQLAAAGADRVGTTLAETVSQLDQVAAVLPTTAASQGGAA